MYFYEIFVSLELPKGNPFPLTWRAWASGGEDGSPGRDRILAVQKSKMTKKQNLDEAFLPEKFKAVQGFVDFISGSQVEEILANQGLLAITGFADN